MSLMAALWHKTPCPGDHETYNFSRLFIGHHYNILSLSDLCLGLVIGRRFFKEIVHFPYITYMAMPKHKNSCPGVHKIYNPSLVIVAMHLVSVNQTMGVYF